MRNKLVLVAIVLALLTVKVYSQDVPLPLQTKLMLKICSMDRNFTRFGDPVKIGVSSENFLKELNATKGKMTIKGKDFSAEIMGSPDDISKYKIVYIGKNWESHYGVIADKAKSSQSLVFCETENGVLSGGGAVSFKVVGGKPKIVVNLENAKQQGSDFPANFLKVTVVVGGLK
jgi:hypothetical protein